MPAKIMATGGMGKVMPRLSENGWRSGGYSTIWRLRTLSCCAIESVISRKIDPVNLPLGSRSVEAHKGRYVSGFGCSSSLRCGGGSGVASWREEDTTEVSAALLFEVAVLVLGPGPSPSPGMAVSRLITFSLVRMHFGIQNFLFQECIGNKAMERDRTKSNGQENGIMIILLCVGMVGTLLPSTGQV